jgi:hypothetical protein
MTPLVENQVAEPFYWDAFMNDFDWTATTGFLDVPEA